MNMRLNKLMRRLVQALVLNLVIFVSPSYPGVIGTDQSAASSAAQQDRAANVSNRETVKQQLEALGVKPGVARDRVAAMSDEEIGRLAQKLEAVAAGGALSTHDLLLVLLIAILVALAL